MARKNDKAEGGTATLELPKTSRPNSLRLMTVKISAIRETGRNHRIHEDGIDELAASMAVQGLEQPIKVAQVAGGFELVFGHRRLAAARKLGWETIEAIVADANIPSFASDARAIENLQRTDLNPIEAALAVGEIMDQEIAAARQVGGLKEDQEPTADAADAIREAALKKTAARIGKPVRWVRDHVFLGTLDKTTRELVVNGKLPWEHARELAKVADIEKRAELAKRAAIRADGWGGRSEQPMTLGDLRDQVAPFLRSLAQAPWKLDVEFANAPACNVCPSNSKNQTGLFEHHGPQYARHAHAGKEPDAGVCMNAACYGRKSGLANRQASNAAKKVQVTVSAAPKAERDKAQKAAVAKLAPAVVKPAAFAAAVKDKMETKATAKSAASSRSSTRAETPESKAKRELELALDDWEGDYMTEAVNSIAKVHPETQAMLMLINRDERVHACSYGKASPARLKSIRELLYLAAIPTYSNFEKLVRSLKFRKHEVLDLFEGCDFGELLQSVFPFEFEKPKPTLEDFLPKAKPAKADKPAKDKKAKGKANNAPHGPGVIGGPNGGELGYCHRCLNEPAVAKMGDGGRLCQACIKKEKAKAIVDGDGNPILADGKPASMCDIAGCHERKKTKSGETKTIPVKDGRAACGNCHGLIEGGTAFVHGGLIYCRPCHEKTAAHKNSSKASAEGAK